KRERVALDLREIAEVANDALHLLARAQDGLENAARPTARRILFRDGLQDEVRPHRHRRERRAEIVTNRSEERVACRLSSNGRGRRARGGRGRGVRTRFAVARNIVPRRSSSCAATLSHRLTT